MNWETEFWGNTLLEYGYTLGATLLFTTGVLAITSFFRWRLKSIGENGRLPFFLAWKALHSTKWWLVFLIGFTFTSAWLELSPEVSQWMQALFFSGVIIQLLFWGNRALLAWGERYSGESSEAVGARVTTVKMFLFLGRIALLSLGLLVILDSLPGVQITALIASLGIGGIAVALAMQNILSDIFASLTITLDRPFVIGDFIIVGDLLGVVEKIGIKTTRLRSLSGEQLIFSNNDLLNSRIRNFKRMYERRVAFEIGITYETGIDKIREIPDRIESIIKALPDTRFDRAHFKQHGAHALIFEIVYYVNGPDYNLYMDRQQAINLAIHEYFEQNGIQFAYPTQTLYLNRTPS